MKSHNIKGKPSDIKVKWVFNRIRQYRMSNGKNDDDKQNNHNNDLKAIYVDTFIVHFV